MSESHGSVLILKHHEDMKKVADYVKQQVRDESLRLLGEDLSEDDKYVGLRIDELENNIIWHDYGHHGKHLDFWLIANKVIKEFPDVEIELENFYGNQDTWTYIVVDGAWVEYTALRFVAYTEGRNEEVILDYKELKDDKTEEEKCALRDKMCKELLEKRSLLEPDVEMIVYFYNPYDVEIHIDVFYRGKNGHALEQIVDLGMAEVMAYIDEMEWVESIGQYLLHLMDNAAEIIKRAREGDEFMRYVACMMMAWGDTARYFSLIEPTDKNWLMERVENHDDANAIYCLLHGFHHKYNYRNQTFVDDESQVEYAVLLRDHIDGSIFEAIEDEEKRLIQKVENQKHRFSVEMLKRLCQEIRDNTGLLLERIRKGDEEAAMEIDSPSILQELCDKGNKFAAEQLAYKYAYGDEKNGVFIDHRRAEKFMSMAGKEYNPDDFKEYFGPHEFKLTLSGDASTLQKVQALVNNLCEKYGTPGNELGMYVPMDALMRELVGSPYYEGNILGMESETPDRLIISAEADDSEPLYYALSQRFKDIAITVEMKY